LTRNASLPFFPSWLAFRDDLKVPYIMLRNTMATLEKYNRKRKFPGTPEPKGAFHKNEKSYFRGSAARCSPLAF